MSGVDSILCIASLVGLGAAAFFAGTVPGGRFGWLTVLTAAGCAVGAALGHHRIEVGPEWVPAAVAVGAASALASGRAAPLLVHFLFPVWALGALAIHRAALPLWGRVGAVGALAAAALPLVLLGVRARSLRERSWFVDLGLFALVGGLSLLAGPAALVGWQRAAVAAEGQDVATASVPLWPLALGAGAFFAGLAWRLRRSRSRITKGR